MRFIGYKIDAIPMIGRVTPDAKVVSDHRHRDLLFRLESLGQAARHTSRALELSEINEVPAIPVGAAVFCVGLNYRAHAAR